SCNSYNMLRLTENLFRKDPFVKYIDYYERTLYNHILSTQHPVHGGYVYFTPARPQHYRVYSSPNQGMWCCVGSGMENHGKYNLLIYTHQQNSLYLNLFIASELNWKEKGVKIKQENNFPYEEKTKLTITNGAAEFSLMIRYPSWVKEGTLKISVNGKPISFSNLPSSYISVKRQWKKGDVLEILLPMQTTIEHLPNLSSYIAFMRGPVLLGAKTGTEDLKGLIANDSRWGHIAGGKKIPLDQAPLIVENNISTIGYKLQPVTGNPLSFRLTGIKLINPVDVVLEPFYKIHDARYLMYWMALSEKQYQSHIDSIAAIEKQKLDLQKRTIDFVAPGEQQPEADHVLQHFSSRTGNFNDEFWRDANNSGWFSYNLSTNSETDLALHVRYWGAEWGSRKFDIYIDEEKLVTEDNTGRWNQSAFQNIEYQIPESMVKGKKNVRIKFQALPGNTAGAVYYLRLVKQKK
ncbi:MAG TPA: DUF6805 domain-containing protein, partial [Chitinophagaceae bacterium]